MRFVSIWIDQEPQARPTGSSSDEETSLDSLLDELLKSKSGTPCLRRCLFRLA